MKVNKTTLLIPVENQVRELDPKLLLACVAVRRGLPCIIGFKQALESRLASFPRSVYLAKSMFRGNSKFLGLARKLGHENVAWDEEALVHLPPEIYFSRRLSAESVKHVSELFAWGEDNAELWRQYPDLREGTPIHVTGNPRGDLLRPELRGFYNQQVEEIRDKLRDFILVNTNFNHVNAFSPERNLFRPVQEPGEKPKFGRAARGMTREYAEGLRDHKQAVFEDFQRLIPSLEKAFPEYTIVVRPHPTENQDAYQKIAEGCRRVNVTNEGNVVPWLMATKALIHNGCTTAVEAFAMGVPAISYRATVNDYYDYGFYQLPNGLSYQCFDFDGLEQTLRKVLSGRLGPAEGDDRQALIARHVAAQDGPLACERIVDVLEEVVDRLSRLSKPGLRQRLEGWFKATKRRARKQSKLRDKDSQGLLEFHRHKYPEVSLDELRERVARFQHLLGDDGEIKVESIYEELFRISR